MGFGFIFGTLYYYTPYWNADLTDSLKRNADFHRYKPLKNNYMHLLHQELTALILKTFYEVYNELGYGFLEKVYQNALFLELKEKGLNVVPNKKIKVFYKGNNVGDYYSDLIVNDTVILELKAAECVVEEFETQLLNYLRATDC